VLRRSTRASSRGVVAVSIIYRILNNIGKLVESHKHDITQILSEALDHERATLREYYNLLALVVDRSVWLEEYAREQIALEEQHIAEVDKMMRKPGELHPTG
jgi:bacterioferritin